LASFFAVRGPIALFPFSMSDREFYVFIECLPFLYLEYTPHLEFRPSGCDFFCQVCQQVCPNRAIHLQTFEEKQTTPIGVARIDEKVCVVFKDKVNCLVCEEVCSVPQKLIRYEMITETDEAGEPLGEPSMVPEACIGCGICWARCPAEPVAIRVAI
jgi:formate hydrogenlyase subunit 6/NADH:ubiquinone oxidoreductase subunit I